VAELSGGRRASAVGALFVARVVYAYNWYNVGAVLPLIGTGLSAGPASLGLVLGAFLVGVSIFQVPAGLASVRFGPRPVSLAGIAVLGASGLASAFAPSWPVLAILRFVAGAGAAFFFSPALGLIASYFPPAHRGPAIGLFNGGFSVGGALGLFVGAGLGVAYGWPAALGAGGAVMLAVTAIAWVVVPRAPASVVRRRPGSTRAVGLRVLRSRSIWALSIALAGFWAAVYIVAQYFVDYAQTVHPAWGIGLASVLTAVVVVMALPGGPFGGWLAERGGDRRVILGVSGAIASLLIFAIPFASLLELWPLFLALGFFDGMCFSILYLIPSYLPEAGGEGLALGVGVVNSIQVIVGSAAAIAFGFIVSAVGYTDAWLFAGFLSLGVLPLLVLVLPNRAPPGGVGRPGAAPAAPAPSGP
jgi:predicted MFS family arabinose efflux permease